MKCIQLFVGFCKYYRKMSYFFVVKEYIEWIVFVFVDKLCWEDLFYSNIVIVNELIYIYLIVRVYKKKQGLKVDDQIICYGL